MKDRRSLLPCLFCLVTAGITSNHDVRLQRFYGAVDPSKLRKAQGMLALRFKDKEADFFAKLAVKYQVETIPEYQAHAAQWTSLLPSCECTQSVGRLFPHVQIQAHREAADPPATFGHHLMYQLHQQPHVTVSVLDPSLVAREAFRGLYTGEMDAALDELYSQAVPAVCPDVVIRATKQRDFTEHFCERTLVLVYVDSHFMGEPDGNWADLQVSLLVPSRWAMAGFLSAGVPASRMQLLQPGVDHDIFQPSLRTAVRASVEGSDAGAFVLLHHVSPEGPTASGTRSLVQAFAQLQEEGGWWAKTGEEMKAEREVRLVLVAGGTALSSRGVVSVVLAGLLDSTMGLSFVNPFATKGNSSIEIGADGRSGSGNVSGGGGAYMTMAQASLVCNSDLVVAPYLYMPTAANSPVLQAAACGIGSLASMGPTDELLHEGLRLPFETTSRYASKGRYCVRRLSCFGTVCALVLLRYCMQLIRLRGCVFHLRRQH
jgi:hypothetical protein